MLCPLALVTSVEKIKILILSANPKNTDRLRLDEEVREIEQSLGSVLDLLLVSVKRLPARPSSSSSNISETLPFLKQSNDHLLLLQTNFH